MAQAAFAAGCFWGVQHEFDQITGVTKTIAGYMGGKTKNPTYEEVCTGKTGHAETVFIEFDEDMVSYEELLNIFWNIHDPSQKNRQGPDIGTQYRSVIFYYTEKQRDLAVKLKDKISKLGKFNKPIATEIVAASDFYPAEKYHQDYFKKHGATGCPI
jgi:peptide-methionine (S)-S-oxide reductase